MQRRSRVTVTVPDAVLAIARDDVARGSAPSLSAWVTDAAEAKARRESLIHVLDELLDASGGPLSPEETAWAREQLRAR
jgi:hypothetical protein